MCLKTQPIILIIGPLGSSSVVAAPLIYIGSTNLFRISYGRSTNSSSVYYFLIDQLLIMKPSSNKQQRTNYWNSMKCVKEMIGLL